MERIHSLYVKKEKVWSAFKSIESMKIIDFDMAEKRSMNDVKAKERGTRRTSNEPTNMKEKL